MDRSVFELYYLRLVYKESVLVMFSYLSCTNTEKELQKTIASLLYLLSSNTSSQSRRLHSSSIKLAHPIFQQLLALNTESPKTGVDSIYRLLHFYSCFKLSINI